MPSDSDLLRSATQSLVRTVDALAEPLWTGPSLLPGWSRAHLVAHLTLNAEALAGVLEGLREGEPVPMYPSLAARDGDIADLAVARVADLRERFLASTTTFVRAAEDLPPEAADERVERIPDGPTFVAREAVGMRLREVEVHHADLDAGYTRHRWPVAFAELLVDLLAAPRAGSGRLVASDLDRTWDLGGVGPTVTGAAADLGWWLTGRGGDDLTSDHGPVPEIGAI